MKFVNNKEKIIYSIDTLQGVGNRENQQDSIFAVAGTGSDSDKAFAVLADGMGGLTGGAESSGTVTETGQSAFECALSETEQRNGFCYPVEWLIRNVMESDQKVKEVMEANGGERSGSTMIGALFLDRKLYFNSVGDSRIYLVKKDKQMIQLNREHNYKVSLERMAAEEKISREEADTDRQRDALTSYIGMKNQIGMDYNMIPIELVKGDKVLLMSDGVYGTLTMDELREALGEKNGRQTMSILDQMIKGKAKPGQDNYSAILVQIK